jgi:hypothetical protein
VPDMFVVDALGSDAPDAPEAFVPGVPEAFVPGVPEAFVPGVPEAFVPGVPEAFVPGAFAPDEPDRLDGALTWPLRGRLGRRETPPPATGPPGGSL